VNCTACFDERSGAPNSIDDDNSSGAALQTGEDVAISGEWFVNADVKKLFLDSDVSGTTGRRRQCERRRGPGVPRLTPKPASVPPQRSRADRSGFVAVSRFIRYGLNVIRV